MSETLRKGIELFGNGRIDEAEEHFRAVIDRDPADKEAQNNLGVIAFQKGKAEEAVDYFIKALNIDPLYVDAAVNMSLVLKAANCLYEAMPLLESLASKCGDNREIMQLLEEARRSREKSAHTLHPIPGLKTANEAVVRESEYDRPIVSSPSLATPAEHGDTEIQLRKFPYPYRANEEYPESLRARVGTIGCSEDLAEARRNTRGYSETIKPTVQDQAEVGRLPERLYRISMIGDYSRGKKASPSKSDSKAAEDILGGKKILHAPFEIAGNMERIARLLRNENVDATSVNYYDSWLDYRCDINLNVTNMSKEQREEKIRQFAEKAVDEYDIFHFHFGHSLYPDLHDLEKLRSRGKKVLVSFWGSDRRAPEWIFYQQARFLGYAPPKPYFLNQQLYINHKTFNRYADVMIGATSIPRGIWIRGHADVSAWTLMDKEAIIRKRLIDKDPKKIYFVHAPSSDWKKGTGMIIRLLRECRDEGMPVEILHIKKLPPDKAREVYAYADYAVDQVGVGTFGLFGVEAMCWQIPVLVYQNDLMNRLRNYPPVINIAKSNFKEQIANCIRMKQSGENEEIGKAGRQWVIDNEDVNLAIPEYMRIYRDLVEGKEVLQYVNRSWYEEEHRLQSGIKSEFYKYMIEENVFDEIGLNVEDYDKRLYV